MNPTTDYWLTDDTQKARNSNPKSEKRFFFELFPTTGVWLRTGKLNKKRWPDTPFEYPVWVGGTRRRTNHRQAIYVVHSVPTARKLS